MASETSYQSLLKKETKDGQGRYGNDVKLTEERPRQRQDDFKFSRQTRTLSTSSLSSSFSTHNVNLVQEKISRVEHSWFIISNQNRVGIVGEKFFIRMFEEHAEIAKLFPFGEDALDRKTGKLVLNARVKKHIRAHASAVMRTVGTCVSGLTSIEDLVPRLRSIGTTHKMVGVQNMHYDMLYRHLIHAIREEVGSEWCQETEDAWYAAYTSITDLIKRPSKRLETEPLQGWGLIMLFANVYFALVTPFRFAGFYIGQPTVIRTLDILDGLCAFVMLLEVLLDVIQSKIRIQRSRFVAMEVESDDESVDSFGSTDSATKIERIKSFILPEKYHRSFIRWIEKKRMKMQRNFIKYLHILKMDRWVPWSSLDMRVLISFLLQGLFYHGSLCSTLGLHWTQLFGLLRLSCVSRVLHFVQCAENNVLLQQKLNADRQLTLRIIKLLVRLAFMTHVSACLWCAIARVELGPEATDFTASTFFPNPEILSAPDKDVFASYSRAIHWAFVNLAGIGNVDSVPETTIECWVTLCVHGVGAVFYAVVTGNVISILEDRTADDNKVGTEIVRLSNFLKSARVSDSSKERIVKGYIMRNVLTEGGSSGASSEAAFDRDLDTQDMVLQTLPNYLRMEIGIYARAELIRRHDKFFAHCHKNFLVALSGSLVRTRTLLPGDYLIKRGEKVFREFVVVESGELQIRHTGETLKFLKKGDSYGKSWLVGDVPTRKTSEVDSELTDWLNEDVTAALSIRAIKPCVLMTGLTTRDEIDALERAYPVDFQFLRAECRGSNMDENERRMVAMRGIAKAVRRFKCRRLVSKITAETDPHAKSKLTAQLYEQVNAPM